MDRILGVALLHYTVGVRFVAIEEGAVVVDMRERIQVRVSDSVVSDADLVHSDREHLDLVRISIVDRFDGVGVAGHRDGEAFFHETGGLLSFSGRDQVYCADLIVLPSAAPIGQALLPALVLRLSHFVVVCRCGCLG